jgi:hypothetical protein
MRGGQAKNLIIEKKHKGSEDNRLDPFGNLSCAKSQLARDREYSFRVLVMAHHFASTPLALIRTSSVF